MLGTFPAARIFLMPVITIKNFSYTTITSFSTKGDCPCPSRFAEELFPSFWLATFSVLHGGDYSVRYSFCTILHKHPLQRTPNKPSKPTYTTTKLNFLSHQISPIFDWSTSSRVFWVITTDFLTWQVHLQYPFPIASLLFRYAPTV